jgi:(p)ppGpp synthase/HD superfamily hydrolase
MNDIYILSNLVLAPYIIKATALISNERKVGGNQFRHAFATLGILLDYKYFDNSVLLKASLIHDLIEEVPATNIGELRSIDEEANQVVDLVLEVTRKKSEPKAVYLKGILEHGSFDAKTLKVADRISNLTDLHRDIYSDEKMAMYLDQTEKYVVPMAEEVNHNMVTELTDLIIKRREMLKSIDN